MTPRELVELCANGDKAAAEWMMSLHSFAHAIDDAIDEPSKLKQEQFGRDIIRFVMSVSSNPFYRRYHDRFEPLLEQAVAAWVDSDRPQNVEARDFLKAQWHELFWHTARLTGGWVYMRRVQLQAREYDKEGAE